MCGVRRSRQNSKVSLSLHFSVHQDEVGSMPHTEHLPFGSSEKQASGPPAFKYAYVMHAL